VTSETSQIQTLIHQIDEVLNKTSPRLPWVMSSDAAQQRQVLEQTRRYLLSLQSEKATSTGNSAATDRSGTTENQEVTANRSEITQRQETASAEASAQQVLQSVLQEMTYLRTNMLQPMRSDVEVLQQQRESLLQEVRRLEMQRQQYITAQQPPAYFQEYMQVAMKQIQENLSGQVAQMMAAMTAQTAQLQGTESMGGTDLAALSPVERLERLRAIQSQSDQLLLRLDTTLRVVFESLQRNLQSYQDSLGEGLGRMHDMGQQGEAVFAAFVTRLAQILGREASSFLQAPQPGWGDERLPYGDTARTLPGQDAPDRLRPENDPDQQISRLLEELNALDQSGLNQTVIGEPIPFEIDDPNSPLSPEAERERLEELDRELSQLDLSALADTPTDIKISPIAEEEDPFFPFPPFPEDEKSIDHSPANQQSATAAAPDSLAWDDDLDSALDLLNQISATVPEDRTETGRDIESASEQRISALPQDKDPDPVGKTEFASTPDDLYQDEFYQDLFGSGDEPESSQVGNPVEPPADDRASGTGEARTGEISITGDRLPEETAELEVGEIDVNHDLFAGLADPSQADPFPADGRDLPNIKPFSEFPQSVENLLVRPSEPQPPIEDLTLDTFWSEDIPDPLAGIEPEPAEESVETIASLADLIPDTEPESLAGDDRLSAHPADETYETAHPGEDLLITESPPADPASNLRLPADTLQQLTHDLFNLEGTTRSAEVTESSWTLADWTEAVDASSDPGTDPGTDPARDTTQPFQASDWTDGIDTHPPTQLSNQAIEQLLFTDSFAGYSSSHPPIDPTLNPTPDPTLDPATPSSSQAGEAAIANNEEAGTTIEDWFANVDAEPVVTPETSLQEESTAQSGPNTFTLDGLDSLFEGVPAAPPPRQPSETDTQRITVDDVFGEFDQSPQTGSPPQDSTSAQTSPRTADRGVEKKKHRWNGRRSDS
jgi:hypothetical protein